jgi:hypothetical protein
MIRSSVNLDCFISVSLKVTDSTHFWRKFRGSGHIEQTEPVDPGQFTFAREPGIRARCPQ